VAPEKLVEYVPALHLVQASNAVAPTVEDHEPEGQLLQEEEPLYEYLPALHFTHTDKDVAPE
jgi:hypothetical protein